MPGARTLALLDKIIGWTGVFLSGGAMVWLAVAAINAGGR